MSTPRRLEGPGFGHQGGSNLADYLGATGRANQIELEMEPGERLVEIPIDLIDRSPFQARTNFDPEKIAALGEDVRENGLNHPVTVREASGGRYELVAGERRWLAAKHIGAPTVIARVRLLDDFAAHLVGVSENNRRADLSPWEMSLEAARLLEHAIEASRPHTQRDLAGYLNRNVSLVNQQLAIAAALSPEFLRRAQVTEAEVCRLPHVTLRRICKLDEAQRPRAIREAIRMLALREESANRVTASPAEATGHAQAEISDWHRYWDTGGLRLRVGRPISELRPDQAVRYARQIAPALAALAARGSERQDAEPVIEWKSPRGKLLFLRAPALLSELERAVAREVLLLQLAGLAEADKSSAARP